MSSVRRRRRLVGFAVLVTTLAGALAAASVALADAPQPGAPWPQFKRDGLRSGAAAANGPLAPTRAWAFNAGGAVVRGPVIAADGTIFIGTEGGRVYGVKSDGNRRWLFEIEDGGTPTHPALNSRGHVVVGTQTGFVLALKGDDGAEEWRFDLQSAPYSEGRVSVRGHPVIASNYSHLLIGTDDGNVYELNEDGQFKGVRRVREGPVKAGAAVTPDGTLVWAGTSDKSVYGGIPAGGDKWRLGVDGEVSATPAVAPDSTTYVATEAGSLYAIKSDGTVKWKVKVGDGRAIRSSPAIASDGTIYVGTDDGKLYALDPANGSAKWNFQTGAAITSSPALGANGLIYFGSNDSNLYVLRPDGTLQATFKTEQGIDFSSPAIAPDGTLYIGSRDGNLYALKEGGPTATPIPAVTATPTVPPATPTPTPTPLPTDRVAFVPGAVHFFETGHNVRGVFLAFFTNLGGLTQFGYPRTEEIVEDGRTVQYFQRARFERAPELAGTPYEVQLQLLGDVVTAPRRPFPTAAPVESTEDVRYFPEVGHTTRGIFLRYFNANGGLDRFGFPISEELQEQNDDGTGRTYTVQYFQRARLESHPELAGTPFEIQLGLLGDQVLRQRGWLR